MRDFLQERVKHQSAAVSQFKTSKTNTDLKELARYLLFRIHRVKFEFQDSTIFFTLFLLNFLALTGQEMMKMKNWAAVYGS